MMKLINHALQGQAGEGVRGGKSRRQQDEALGASRRETSPLGNSSVIIYSVFHIDISIPSYMQLYTIK